MKILDRDGLAYFWTKIKAYVASLVAPKADDANVVHKTGTELVEGDKTFKPDGEGDSTNGSVALVFRNRYFDRTSASNPSRHNWTTLIFGDKQNEVWVKDEHDAFAGRLGAVECYTDSLTGATMIRLCCHKGLYSPGIDEEVMSCLRVGVNANGIPFVRCVSTPETPSVADDVLTRDWIPKDTRIVHTTGNETIAGTKTFSTGVTVHERGVFLAVENYHIDKGTAPSATNYHTLVFYDKNGNSASNRFGFFENFVEQGTGKVCTKIGAYKNVADSTDYAELCLWHWPDGTKYATCPTPSSLSNSNAIATTEWVNAKGYITSSGSITGNAATATELATARTISLSGAVTGSASFDGSADSGISTVWRSCLVGQSGSSGTNPWYKVATCVADRASDDIIITFLVETTYYSHATGILKIHVRTNASKVIDTSASEIFWLSATRGIADTLSDYVLVCPSAASSTVELWTRISGGYQFRRFVVLSEGSRASTWIRWTLLDAASAGQAASITTAGTQIASVLIGRANNVTGTVAIANGGTGATTRLDAIKALTNENVGTDATDFITAKTGWSKCGYTSVADTKTVLGLKSAAYTDSTDYAARFKSSVMDVTSASVGSDQWYVRGWLDKNGQSIVDKAIEFESANAVRHYSLRIYDKNKTQHWLLFLQINNDGTSPLLNAGGTIKPQANNTFALGNANYKWTAVYATNGSIQTSDARLKSDVGSIPDEVLDAWEDVDWIQYRLNSSIAEKGDGARLHSGLVAQELDRIFSGRGLDASRYGLFCHDEWDAVPDVLDENGNAAVKGVAAGDAYSIRYDEALAVEAAYMRRENARLKKRVAGLEERLAALEMKLS